MGDRLNNKLSNLEWTTPSDNVRKNYLIEKNRQVIKPIEEKILNNSNWQQYLNSNYCVSKEGKCANIKTGKYLNPVETNNGYLKYSLYLNGKSKNILAHKLVYLSFYPDDLIQENEQNNHIDGNKTNDNLFNLEKNTGKENMIHSCCDLQQNIIKIVQYDLNNNLIAIYASLSEATRQNDYSVSGISQEASGKIKNL